MAERERGRRGVEEESKGKEERGGKIPLDVSLVRL